VLRGCASCAARKSRAVSNPLFVCGPSPRLGQEDKIKNCCVRGPVVTSVRDNGERGQLTEAHLVDNLDRLRVVLVVTLACLRNGKLLQRSAPVP